VQRVHVDQFKAADGRKPMSFIRCDDGSLREVPLAPQSGSQEAFFSCLEREALLCGPRGTGKSLTLIMTFLAQIGLWGAAWKGIVIRRNMTGFQEFKDLLREYIATIWPDARFNENQNRWVWTTGEQLKLGYFESNNDFSTYIGSSYSWIGWEELCQYADSKAYDQILSCLRCTVPGVPLMVRSTTNSFGPGSNWVRKKFRITWAPGSGVIIGPRIDDDEGLPRRVVYSTLAENKLQPPDYRATLLASTRGNAGQRLSWVDGSWDGLGSGDMFGDIWPDAAKHCVLSPIPPSAIPPTWKITCAYDYGDSSPFSMLYAAISDGSPIIHDGRTFHFVNGDILILDEWYGAVKNQPETGVRWTIDRQKRAFIERELATGLRFQDHTGKWIRRVRTGVADNQIFNPKPGSAGAPADSIADEFGESCIVNGARQQGIQFEPADKSPGSRIQGWQNLRGRMVGAMPNAGGARENEGIFICSNCVHWLENVPNLPRDLEGNSEDCPDRCLDHDADATRYLLRRNTQPAVTSGRVTMGSSDRLNGRRVVV
jgi:hypothetical protein